MGLILRHQIELQNNKKSSRQTIVLTIFVLLTAFVLGLRLFLANNLVDQSVELSKINHEIALVETENQTLEQENRELSSFANVNVRAMEMGFAKTAKYSFIQSSFDVASSLVSPVN